MEDIMSDRVERLENELRYITQDYSDNFYEDKEAQRQFLLDIMTVCRYLCNEF